jgi:16S rRNA (guanine527-N7)-methyltransferase
VTESMDPAVRTRLLECLSDAQRIGAVGRGPLTDALEQASGYACAPDHALAGRIVDLGSGGGLPALPLALMHPRTTTWTLVEAWDRRASLLRRSVRALELLDRVEVLSRRAEDVGRGPLRGQADAVVARSFGPASVTLECAAPLLRVGGRVVVSVREDDPAWPDEAIATLGLAPAGAWSVGRFHYRAATLMTECAERWPRRAGQPARHPLF